MLQKICSKFVLRSFFIKTHREQKNCSPFGGRLSLVLRQSPSSFALGSIFLKLVTSAPNFRQFLELLLYCDRKPILSFFLFGVVRNRKRSEQRKFWCQSWDSSTPPVNLLVALPQPLTNHVCGGPGGMESSWNNQWGRTRSLFLPRRLLSF